MVLYYNISIFIHSPAVMVSIRSLLLLLLLQPALLSAAPRVVTSIAPLQEIAAALMQGIAVPETIIDSRASAHHFAFKPSHMSRLQNADLVIWIDAHFEAGFNRIAEILPPGSRQLELLPALGIDDHDGHIWYSPGLLQKSLALIVTALIELDSVNHSRYRANADKLRAELTDWERRLRHRWQNLSPRLLTDHAFLEHFARDLPMFEVSHIQDDHDSGGGLKNLKRLERWLQQKPAACILSLESAGALTRSVGSKYRLPIVDIANAEGSTIMHRLERLEAALETCLGGRLDNSG